MIQTIFFKTNKPEYKKMTLAQIAAENNLSRSVLYSRLRGNQKAFIEDLVYSKRSNTAKLYIYEGEELTAKQWAIKVGVTEACMHSRLKTRYVSDAINGIARPRATETKPRKMKNGRENEDVVLEDFDIWQEAEVRIQRWLDSGMSVSEILIKQEDYRVYE